MRLLPFRGTGLKSRLLNPSDSWRDYRLGIDTVGYSPAVGAADAADLRVHYEPTPYKRLRAILRRLELKPDDVLVDYGSGLGRAVFVASNIGIARAIGVEANSDLADRARANYRRSTLTSNNIEFLNVFAETYTPTDVTAVYMFHPFGPGTMQSVVNALERDLARKPRTLRIAYNNPICGSVLEGSSAWSRFDDWPAEGIKNSYPVTFWTTG